MFRVLVIEDDTGVLQIFERVLTRSGYAVVTAATGERALTLAGRVEIDVILADLRLPDMSGVDVIRQVRNQGRSIPSVIVKAHGTIESAVEATKLGADAYLHKPVDTADLVTAVRNAVARGALAQPTHEQALPEAELPAAVAWARTVASAVHATSDPKHLKSWSKCAGASSATLKNRCVRVGVSAKRSLDLARLLRALAQAQHAGSAVHAYLDADPRTLRRLLHDANLDLDDIPEGQLPSLIEFLQRQTLVTLPELRSALRNALAPILATRLSTRSKTGA
jgi:DNA-binding response OmpR family regulator